jgi:hypothetical protein
MLVIHTAYNGAYCDCDGGGNDDDDDDGDDDGDDDKEDMILCRIVSVTYEQVHNFNPYL